MGGVLVSAACRLPSAEYEPLPTLADGVTLWCAHAIGSTC
jgi:hypothetical protein